VSLPRRQELSSRPCRLLTSGQRPDDTDQQLRAAANTRAPRAVAPRRSTAPRPNGPTTNTRIAVHRFLVEHSDWHASGLLRAHVGGTKVQIRGALERLLEAGLVERVGQFGATKWRARAPA